MSESAVLDDANDDRAAAAPRGALLIIFLIVFVDLLGFGLIIPLLPFYARTFQASDLQVTLLFSTYSICQFIAAPILGVLSDRYGRRPVLVFSQIGSVLGYLLLGWTTHYHANLTLGLGLIYLSRVIDGLSGGNVSTAQAYISDITTAENRARGMGLLGAAFGLGFIAGPGLGGILAHYVNEAAPAYAAAGFSALAALLTFIRLPESNVHRPVEAEAWLHPRVFLPLLKRPVLVQLNAIWFCSMAAYVMIDSTIAIYLNDIFKYQAKDVAWYFVFVGIIIAVVQGGLIRPLMKRGSEWVWCIVGPILVAAGYLITVTSAWQAQAWILIVGGATYAVGRSIQQPTIQSLVSKSSDPREQGTTFGLFQGTGTIARVIGPIIAGAIYTRHVTAPLFTAAAIVALAAGWTIALGARSRMTRSPQSHDQQPDTHD
ncbi:MFS transporter [Fontivita pretiosa]|uniref:MFS transporter n=1 Tax=Fontivita pretiosa TaxID=2989684 RepID=UPI003D17E85D